MTTTQRTAHRHLCALAVAAALAGGLLALRDPVWGYSAALGAAIGLAPQWWAAWRLLRPADPGAALGAYRIEAGKWLLTAAAAAVAFRVEPLAPLALFAALALALFGSVACVALADRH